MGGEGDCRLVEIIGTRQELEASLRLNTKGIDVVAVARV